jgi:hypothetical protein
MRRACSWPFRCAWASRSVGFAASLVSLEPVQARVEELASSDFGGDDVFVADANGRLIVHLDRGRAATLAAAPELDQLVGPDARSEVRDYIGVGPNINSDGVPTISTGVLVTPAALHHRGASARGEGLRRPRARCAP